MRDQTTVACQICRMPMTPQSNRLDLGPADWHPSGDRLAAILSEVFRCNSCGGLRIRPGVVESARPHAA